MPVTIIQRLARAFSSAILGVIDDARLLVTGRPARPDTGPATEDQMTALRRELQRRLGDKIE